MPERAPISLCLVLMLMLAACGGSGGDNEPTGTPPTIGAVGPSSGSPSGGETVTLTGSGFAEPGAGTPIVRFGGVDATNVVVIDNNTITCTVPPHPPGTVDIEIVTNHGTFVLPGAYTYGPAPGIADSLLLTSSNGGSQGVGTWKLYDASTLAPLETLAVSQGAPYPVASLVSRQVGSRLLAGSPAGFAFNPADGKFYGILPGAGVDDGTPTPGRTINEETPPGEVVVFDPAADSLVRLATIPRLYAFGASDPLEEYLTAPVISPDGRSLMMLARLGGPTVPLPPGDTGSRTLGALVHLDIDPASGSFLTFTPVYGMHEYGVGWGDKLTPISMKPLSASTPSGDVIAMVTDGSFGNFGNNAVDLFSLVPGDAGDWSQPWSMLGTPQGAAGFNPSQIHYSTLRNEFWFATQIPPDGTTPGEVLVFRRDGPDGNLDIMPFLVRQTQYGAQNPMAMLSAFGDTETYVLSAGLPSSLPQQLNIGKFLEVSFSNPPVIRAELNAYWTGTDSWLVPAGLTTSRTSGFHFVTATSSYDVADLDFYIDVQLGTSVTSTDPFLDEDLDSLYTQAGLLPSRLDRYDYTAFALTNLFAGAAESGYLIVGAPAVGGLVSEPVSDRYVVAFAVIGGAHGRGAVIKYDRVTGLATTVPFGNSTPGHPVGRAIRLDSGLLLGGTNERVSAGLNPQRRSSGGVWTLDPASSPPAMHDYPLPDTDVQQYGRPVYASAKLRPLAFAKTSDGGVWGVTIYNTFNVLRGPIEGGDYTGEVAGLLAFDPQTGEPTGELHVFGDTGSWRPGSFSQALSARGNILTFVSPALFVDAGTRETGDRVWVVDLDSRDSTGTPASNFALLSPDGGAAGDAWRAPFEPTLDASSGDFYVMTLAAGTAAELRIHRMQVGASVATAPTLTTVVTGETDLPGTALFEASDGLLYYGTQTGRLMRFDPSANTVIEVADLTVSGMTSDVRGFLSEGQPGVIMGIVADSSDVQSAVTRRTFAWTIATQGLTTVDVTEDVSDQDPLPGVTNLK